MRIKKLRTDEGISQRELAEKIGVKQNYISQWESNTKKPGYDMLVLLADYFNTSTDYLLGR